MLKDKGEDYEVWKEYFPKKRELYNIICMDSEKEVEKYLKDKRLNLLLDSQQ